MKKTQMISLLLVLVLLTAALSGCSVKTQPEAAASPQPAAEPVAQPEAQPEPEVTLRVTGVWEDCRAMEWAAAAFHEQYPNCTVVYEFLQGDYNDVLVQRMAASGDDRVDLFITTSNIQSGHALEGNALDLTTCQDLDLSQTFPSLKENFMYIEPDGSPATKLYSVPLGAQMRGLFVNVSLLKSVGIEKVPTNQAELLEACEILQQAGFVPFHGDPGSFPQQLLYPWMCNQIANADNYDEAYQLVNTRDPAATELFRPIYEFLYTLVEQDYYNYNYSQKTLGLCVDASTEGYARSLLNIEAVRDEKGETTGEYVKAEGVGQVAFLPSALSTKPVMDKMKEDYHSDIEYAFVPAPVSPQGGFVYLSPAEAIGINKDTEKLDWAVRFVNFLFQSENNEAFAQAFSIIPNTADAFSYVSSLYAIPTTNISHLGQATFDWSFYRTMTRSGSEAEDCRALGAIARANKPDNLDPATGTLYPFDHFWAQFQDEFVNFE